MTRTRENAFIQTWQEAIFPASPVMTSACTFHSGHYQDALFPLHNIPFEPELLRARDCRRAEFLAGRYLARQMLNTVGIENFYLEPDSHNGPRWPPGFSGSLSHSYDTAVCAVLVNSTKATVGIDIERVITPDDAHSLWPHLIGENEHSFFLSLPYGFPFLLTLVFSARESLFKALSQQTGAVDARQAFSARLSQLDGHTLTVTYCYEGKEEEATLAYRHINQQVITLAKLRNMR